MKTLITTCITLLFLSACSSGIKSNDLYGRWNYIKVDARDLQDTLPNGELELQKPAIIFNNDSTIVIEWGGKTLSSGKFKMDGKMIRYTEDLPNNQKREFPFLIQSLTDKELVFQTMEQNSTVVRAVRAPR